MPRFSSLFYQNQNQSGDAATEKNTGTPHIQNLLEQNPKQWQETGNVTKRVPKTLVFADALAEGWSKTRFEAFKKRLLEAMDLGFQVAFFLNNALSPCPKKTIEDFDYAVFISTAKYIFPLPFEAFCQQTKKAQSDIAYLDDYLSRVFIDNQEGVRQVDTLTFLNMHPTKQKKVLKYLQHASPPVNQILNNTDIEGCEKILSELRTMFPAANVEECIAIANIEPLMFSLNTNNQSSITRPLPEKYCVTGFDLANQTQHIRFLKTGKLTKLSLFSCTIPIENQDILSTLHELPLQGLEELTLCFTRPTDDFYIITTGFLQQCPDLKKLTLTFICNLNNNSTYLLDLGKYPLSSLEIHAQNPSSFKIWTHSLSELKTTNVFPIVYEQNENIYPHLLYRDYQFEKNKAPDNITTALAPAKHLAIHVDNVKPVTIYPSIHIGHLKIIFPINDNINNNFFWEEKHPVTLEIGNRSTYALKSVSVHTGLKQFLSHPQSFPHLKKLTDINFFELSPECVQQICQLPRIKKVICIDYPIKQITPLANFIETLEQRPDIKWDFASCLMPISRLPKGYNANNLYTYYSSILIDGRRFSNPEDIEKNGFKELNMFANANRCTRPVTPTSNLMPYTIDLEKEKTFNPRAALNETPATKDKPFKYKAPSTQKNISDHNVFIQQLSRYLQVAKGKEEQAHIPRLSNGICHVLSDQFKDTPLKTWEENKQSIKNWNGSNPIPSNVTKLLDDLFNRYKNTYFNKHAHTKHYLGETPAPFFNAQKTLLKEGALILNYNHTITVKWDDTEGKWIFYDPNDSNHKTMSTTDELVQIVKGHLGDILAVENRVFQAPSLSDPIAFIQNGGLFAMARGWKGVPTLKSEAFAEDDTWYDGLLLRNTKGMPFWVLGVENEQTRDFTMALLTQFFKKPETQNTHIQRLKQSLEILTPSSRQKVMTLIIQYAATHQSHDLLKHTLINALHTAPNDRHYLEQFTTWVNTPLSTDDLKSYYLDVVSAKEGQKKRLIQFDSTEKTMAMRAQIKRLKDQRSVFFADSPQDLICASPYIEQQKHQGILKPGPGGALYRFLEAAKYLRDPAPLLVVDYSQFSAEEIVRFNSMLDDMRRVDGTDIPEHVGIIGLMDTSRPECYRGEDFYSRFNKVDENPLSIDALGKNLPVNPSPVERQTVKDVLEFHHGSGALATLKGSWALEGEGLRFIEGYEHTRLKHPPQTLTIANGPWDNPLFKTYWRDFQQEHPDITLQTTEGYDWPSLIQAMKPSADNTYEHVLNPKSLEQYFSSYVVDNEKQSLCMNNGILKDKKGQTVSVLLTQSISLDGFARLLHEAKEQEVLLCCNAAYGVDIPPELKAVITTLPKPPALTDIQNAPVALIQSEQPEKTNETFKADKLIDISEVAPHDMLGGLDGLFLKDELKFQFNTLPNRLQHWLDSGETVILTGQFKEELIDALMPMLLARQKNPSAHGKLIITSDDLSGFKGLPTCINAQGSRPQRQEKPPIAPVPLQAFDPDNSESITRAFKQTRLEAVQNALKTHPHVLLTGLTGVGKTTFVEGLQSEDHHVFMGEKRLLEWAKSNAKGQKILFIDEANLAHTDWSMFEGLYHTPRALFYKGDYMTLSDEHKVIFAGNPSSYGGERNMPSFFEHHDHTVEFTTIPAEMMYEDMLKPLISDKTLAAPLLDMYVFLANRSEKEVLISPREVKMIALLALSDKRYPTPEQQKAVLQELTYRIGSTLVPEHYRQDFDAKFKPQNPLPPTPETLGDFIMTPSRAAIYHQIDGLLALRSWRYLNNNALGKTSAMGGMVMEGEPGQGKSELIKAILLAKGYQETRFESSKPPVQPIKDEQKIFYIMPVSMRFKDKKKLLKRAFHEGAVVIIDEINSSPMMERLLNDLAMGKYKGKNALNPGFTLIGTQNPATTMTGRSVATDALKRRFIHMTLPNYTKQELLHIAKTKLPDQKEAAQAIVKAFMQQSLKAQQEHLKPAPTFRAWMKVVKAEAKAFEGYKEAIPDVEAPVEPQAPIAAPSAPIEKTSATTYPESYHRIFAAHDQTQDDNFEKAAKALLYDYTKQQSLLGSKLGLLFFGHWNRHHVNSVMAYLHPDKNKPFNEVLQELKKIAQTTQGSLLKRIEYIEMKNNAQKEPLKFEDKLHHQP